MTPLEGSMAAGTPTMEEKCWGPVRRVVVRREKGEPLGIAIVGGKVRLLCRLQTTSSLYAAHSSLHAPHCTAHYRLDTAYDRLCTATIECTLQVELHKQQAVWGIFIKNVISESPAGR